VNCEQQQRDVFKEGLSGTKENARLESEGPNGSRGEETTGSGETPSQMDGFTPDPVVSSALIFGPSFSVLYFTLPPL